MTCEYSNHNEQKHYETLRIGLFIEDNTEDKTEVDCCILMLTNIL